MHNAHHIHYTYKHYTEHFTTYTTHNTSQRQMKLTTFNNPRLPQTSPQTFALSLYSRHIKETSATCIHALSLSTMLHETITKYCVHTHRKLIALKRTYLAHASYPSPTKNKFIPIPLIISTQNRRFNKPITTTPPLLHSRTYYTTVTAPAVRRRR